MVHKYDVTVHTSVLTVTVSGMISVQQGGKTKLFFLFFNKQWFTD